MPKTTQDIVESLLLKGTHINKFDLYNICGSVCLPQRILDIRQQKGWNISSKSIKGKGTLREYWLDQDEIDRITKVKYEQTGLGLFGGDNFKEQW